MGEYPVLAFHNGNIILVKGNQASSFYFLSIVQVAPDNVEKRTNLTSLLSYMIL